MSLSIILEISSVVFSSNTFSRALNKALIFSEDRVVDFPLDWIPFLDVCDEIRLSYIRLLIRTAL